ncbi:hypothetical protein E2C01_062445 [Portunus trituberculatus]|uniref:Uncharacterized protein n=1 Tax=Portunus trituberculatus TaxID=210409 RepID=A0A5B7HG35_PORTR|nr:hypothetical protein [Portunus trituberculatus]
MEAVLMRHSSLWSTVNLPRKDCIHISYLYATCVLCQAARSTHPASAKAIVHFNSLILRFAHADKQVASNVWLLRLTWFIR